MSQNDKTTFNIVNPSDETKIASGIEKLSDTSRGVMATDDPEQFVGLLSKDEKIFAGESSVLAFDPEEIVMPDKTTMERLRLDLSAHPRLARVLRLNGTAMPIQEAISVLRSLRDDIDANGQKILMKAYDFKVSRKLTLEEKRDPSGNYRFQASVEGKIEDDWVPPESVTFNIPVYKRIPLRVDLTLLFSVVIEHNERDEKAPTKVAFKFESLNLDEDLTAARKAVLTKHLVEDLGIPEERFIWGSFKVHASDDAWRYVQNRFDGITRLEK